MVMLLKKCRLILSTYWTLDLLWVIVLVAGSALQQGGLDFSCLSSLSGAGGCLTEAALVKAVEWVHAWMSFSCVQLFATPWAAACQASLSMGIFQARILEWVAMPSWTAACQAPLSMGVSRQKYWSGLPCPPPGDLPIRDWTQVSCIVGGFFTIWATREAQEYWSG